MSFVGGAGGTGGDGAGGNALGPVDFFEPRSTGYPDILRAYPRYKMPNKFNSNTVLTIDLGGTGGIGDGVSIEGGGSGAGGGVVAIYARECSGTLTIQSNGGNGGDGPATDCGGGGGGPGGLIIFVTNTPHGADSYTFSVDGGIGGVSGGGAGTDGTKGGDGEIYRFEN